MENKLRADYVFALKVMGVYDKYIRNLEKDMEKLLSQGYSQTEVIEVLNELPSFKQFVAASFLWGLTPEKSIFWGTVSSKGEQYMVKLQN